MTTNPYVLGMLDDELRDVVVQAQARLSDDTIMARCHEGLWQVERSEEVVASGLSLADAVAAVEALA